ncbi:transcription elongation factor Spt5 [Candidatus Bathyarchaeota archaeon ex4484_205]|nr:MAG: transcription elongation factor Spt5 [Candidatus Bathyarchaeota archaeon ex4484_205]RLG68926.1 MAG: transcription elongation factor Spt5 [archaeon]
MEEKRKSKVFLVRTTAGQEKNVAELIYAKSLAEELNILSVVAPEGLRGYVFVEAYSPHDVDEAIRDVRHARKRVPGIVDMKDVLQYFEERKIIEELDVGDRVEIIAGIFKHMKARVIAINKPRNEVTIELEESRSPLPISIDADNLKIVEKAKKEEG